MFRAVFQCERTLSVIGGLRRGVVTPKKLKSQLQAVKTTMAPYGIDLGLRDSKLLNKQEMSEKMR